MPGIDARLLKQLVSFVQQLRALDLKKVPSVSETIDWAKVMLLLHTSVLEVDLVRDTLNVLLKFEADIEAASKQLAGLTHKARQDAGVADGGSSPRAPVAPASEPLRRFLQVARGAGLRVSAAEGIDAARAVDLVGFEDRTVLKDTLGLILAKTPEEKAALRRGLRPLLQT